MLPLVRSIATDIAEVFRNVTGRRTDLHRLFRKGTTLSSGPLYDDELAESRADLQEEYEKIWRYRAELESLGVFLRQTEEGGIEFPTIVNGREAFFSWRTGEKTVQFWRFADMPYSTRRSELPTAE
ncbi:hypothetical protein Q31a_32090 [Aureliella helgolandensis]|uniref:DUF2203 domain-containing protein n=2 Tax=Aureliella helgolandensis TaxID=2527968 RepID=A0A518G8H5_9BACT|nr:hypothetical protein Q31a_32090 [Aureliella helgolandensis]